MSHDAQYLVDVQDTENRIEGLLQCNENSEVPKAEVVCPQTEKASKTAALCQ